MDNIKIKKVYEDFDLLEYEIEAKNDFVNVRQDFYVEKSVLQQHLRTAINFLRGDSDLNYFEFGCKKGNYTPSFSMRIENMDLSGAILIEFDFEINDNAERKHRCQMYIKTYNSDFRCLLDKLLQSIDGVCDMEFCLYN